MCAERVGGDTGVSGDYDSKEGHKSTRDAKVHGRAQCDQPVVPTLSD